ncbi:MAG: aldo/keto reductase [Betaproteobacteria bacterium]
MRYRVLGQTGLSVSVIGLGCNHLGSWRGKSRGDMMRLLEHAVDRGITFFDTADVYMHGESEAILGEVLSQRRDQVVIATKAGFRRPLSGPVMARVRPYLWSAMQRVPTLHRALTRTRRLLMRQDFSIEYLRSAVDASLKRLRTDRIDLLQLHSPPPSAIARDGALETLQRLRSEGKLRFYGLSFGTAHEAQLGPDDGGVSTLQLPICARAPGAADGILTRARQRCIGVIANQPLMKGTILLNGAAPEAPAARIRSLAQGAMRYATDLPGVTVAIMGTTSTAHLDENVAALDSPPLSHEELEWLRGDRQQCDG